MRLLTIPVVLVVALVAVLSAAEQKQRRQRNRAPVIGSFTSSATTIQVCPFLPNAFDNPQVDLMGFAPKVGIALGSGQYRER